MKKNITIEDFEIATADKSVLICFHCGYIIKNHAPCKFEGNKLLISNEPYGWIELNNIHPDDVNAIKNAEIIILNRTKGENNRQSYLEYVA